MEKHWIKNYETIANSENRKIALAIAEAGLDAINTDLVIKRHIKLENDLLTINNKEFDLSKFRKIYVVGFGKCSCEAAFVLSEILKDKIDDGVVIGLAQKICPRIRTFAGTHPRPSVGNFASGKEVYAMLESATENDLVITIVSGGGSALLCYPESECSQGERLYDTFLTRGKTINELNVVRKHLSLLKGGGLAKVAYPATIIGLIFSDVPGDNFDEVASGPTYKDTTTINDAQRIIDENRLGVFDLIETPKDDVYFKRVHNFVLVSNKIAVEAMARKSESLGFPAQIISSELYNDVDEALKIIFSNKKNKTTVLAAGEPKVLINKTGGSGGRNMYMGLKSIDKIEKGSVFIPIASDGMDNSDVAGVIVDESTKERVLAEGIDIEKSIEDFDAYTAFEKIGDTIVTGSTNANVSDLMILFTNEHE